MVITQVFDVLAALAQDCVTYPARRLQPRKITRGHFVWEQNITRWELDVFIAKHRGSASPSFAFLNALSRWLEL